MSLLPVNTPNFLRGFAAFFYNIIWLMKNSKIFGFTTALILSLRQEDMCSFTTNERGWGIKHPHSSHPDCGASANGLLPCSAVSEGFIATILSLWQEHNVMCSHLRLLRGGEVFYIPNHPSIKRWCCQRTACSAVSEGVIAIIISLRQGHMCSHLRLMRGGWGIKHPHSSLDQSLVLSARDL